MHRYLRVTHSTLEIDFFNFDWFINIYKEWSPDRKLVEVPDTYSIFLCCLFVKEIIDLPSRQINDPSSGKHFLLSFLPATPLSSSRILELLKVFLSSHGALGEASTWLVDCSGTTEKQGDRQLWRARRGYPRTL